MMSIFATKSGQYSKHQIHSRPLHGDTSINDNRLDPELLADQSEMEVTGLSQGRKSQRRGHHAC